MYVYIVQNNPNDAVVIMLYACALTTLVLFHWCLLFAKITVFILNVTVGRYPISRSFA